ncbi:hypothetical protein NT239_03170 [Chitinibacter sp. SCUT-21]|uniref:hypothetical protein n=1 Tax=Chitinibacter sp. SCUT-21 TaxID=2970891 RepID=UPI0035A68554
MANNPLIIGQVAQQIANFKTQALGEIQSGKAFDIAALASEYISTQQTQSTLASNTAQGIIAISAIGRNMALPDPESAYKMMSHINQLGVLYPAQSARLSEMQSGVQQLAEVTKQLQGINAAADFASVKKQLQNFADQYNQWRLQFNDDVQDPELLADTQAAHMARYELAQSISSPFHGAQQGIQGMAALGLTIDPVTQMAKVDVAQLEQAWGQPGAVGAINEFAAHFSRSASMLTEQNNFFAKQQANLARVIDYMDDNKTKLQQEFGLGDPPQVSAKIAQAYADYQHRHGLL